MSVKRVLEHTRNNDRANDGSFHSEGPNTEKAQICLVIVSVKKTIGKPVDVINRLLLIATLFKNVTTKNSQQNVISGAWLDAFNIVY